MFDGLFQPMHLLVIMGLALLVFSPKRQLSKGRGKVSAPHPAPTPTTPTPLWRASSAGILPAVGRASCPPLRVPGKSLRSLCG